MKTVDYPVDKNEWHPSLFPGPIVLISTYNLKKEPNVAPKSWLQMVSFKPPIIMFSGTKGSQTEKNIMKTKCFGVNFVDSSMASAVYCCTKWSGRQRILKSGFKLVEASKIQAPLVDNCRAHLECRHHSTKTVSGAFVISGEIVAASIWDRIVHVDCKERYALLDQTVYLEPGMFARINKACQV
jgi:flavin reductase (DIM6/NTAB) family NADH-FMN oxidoreductase RutF